MKPYANLHLHSTHSDGVYTPSELVKIAKQEGYKAIAITDHDTATAFPELKEACEAEGMGYIFGVEFSVVKPHGYHIVGFNFDYEYPEMKKYLADMAFRQTDNTKKCFDLAVEKGDITGITWEGVLAYNKNVAWLCNNHVFNAMLDKGLVQKENYMKWFLKNFNLQRGLFPPSFDFKPADELISLINEAGGIAVLAHPSHSQLETVPELIELGLKGIEVSHPDIHEEDREEIYKIAINNNLFMSGGTDHSGLCGGFYSSYESDEKLKKSSHYIEPLHFGATKEQFDEIRKGKINR